MDRGRNKKKTSGYRRPAQNTSGLHSRRRNNHDLSFAVAGAGIIVVLVLVIFAIHFFGSSKREKSNMTLEAAEVGEDTILQEASIDLSAILAKDTNEDTRIFSITGMTPAEIESEIQKRYDWSMEIANPEADVGAKVLQTVDVDSTTAEATMGDEEHPDSISGEVSREDDESTELIVTDTIAVPDFIAMQIPAFLSDIVDADKAYRESLDINASSEVLRDGFFSQSEEETSESIATALYDFTLDMDMLEEEIEALTQEAATMWYVEPQGGSIGSYDSDSDTFVLEGSRTGYSIDTDKLKEDIISAIDSRDYKASIEVTGKRLVAESNITVGDYGVIGSYTTRTSANAIRNKNIKLACEALNGIILRPGEEFSFNDVVGERTEEKGYGAAAAYNNGEVVQEIGGGVCQVSTTLYNAVTKAGLKTTSRQSHTFEPTYVTPGQDATISWGGPDYKFANTPAISEYSNSEIYAIGIRASYADNVVSVSIYSRPVLKSGYEYEFSSEKIKDLDLVRVLIEPGDEKTPTTGSTGSIWETTLVVKKDGETTKEILDHKSYYTGHTEYYYAEEPTAIATPNISGNPEIGDEPMLPEDEESELEDEITTEASTEDDSVKPPSTTIGDNLGGSGPGSSGGVNSIPYSQGGIGPGPLGPGGDNSAEGSAETTHSGGGIVAPGGPGSI